GRAVQAPASAPAPPPPEVGVVTVAPQAVALQTELPGRVEPVRVAQVRARVNGVVLKRAFQEGSEVRAGQLLFLIDAAPYRAAIDSAQAALARAQASQTQAAAQARRYRTLAEANAISQQEYQSAVAASQQAEADVAAARAAVQTARINLGYANVTAPIGGRIGRALVTEGALVSATEATPLAIIQQTSTVYVNFTQSTTDVLRLRQALAANQIRRAGDGAAVRVVLEDGSELPRPGKLLFTDLSVDATSGQVMLRAEVPNPDGLLLPGQYVRVRIAQAELPSAILLPQQAVTRGEQGDTVLVVGADDKPVPRPVKIGSGQNNQWVVLDGLKPGEKVIVDGFQKMFVPGAPVKPVPWTGSASAAAASASASAAAPSASAPASAGR
ncbi:MAG TPA: efflux RND transporter periplasmic adaptor subunit, partial [Croceibacterium sp.]|nr:efflux RND transporter periplasmic adaptor subunit [Croceibacterium sp.]